MAVGEVVVVGIGVIDGAVPHGVVFGGVTIGDRDGD